MPMAVSPKLHLLLISLYQQLASLFAIGSELRQSFGVEGDRLSHGLHRLNRHGECQ
jgi:hypothetical protein